MPLQDRWPLSRHTSSSPLSSVAAASNPHSAELSSPELISLACAVVFFGAFFLALYVELKARHTVYQLICKFFYMNHEW